MPLGSKYTKVEIASTIGLTFQHLLIALPAIIAVPVLFGAIVGLSQEEIVQLTQASVLISGAMTILHSIRYKGIGSAAPMVIGADMAIIAIGIRAASQMNLRTFFTMIAMGAIFAWAVAYFLPKRLKLISPPVIVATMLIYSVSFLPIALDWFLGGVGSPDYGSMRNILVGASVLAFTLFLNQYGRGFLKHGSIGLGLIFGFTISLPLGLVKWTASGSSWISLPEVMPYVPTFDSSTVAIVFPILVVLLVKQLMDLFLYAKQTQLSETEEAELIGQGMRTNAVGYLLSALVGGMPTSAQTQNFGINTFLQHTSRPAILLTGVCLIAVGLLPKFSAALVFIPLPVLGAMGFLLVASLFCMTIETAKHIKWSQKGTLVLSLSFLFGLVALLKPESGYSFSQGFRVLFESGITVSFIAGLFLELVIPEN